MGILDEIKQSYRQGGVLTKLIYINVGVFVVFRVIQIFFSFSSGSGSINDYPLTFWLAIPADFTSFLVKPWTALTYMFLHYDFLHLITNLIMLFWFGKIFLEFLDPRRLAGVYILGGLSGAAMYLLGYNLIPALVVKADTGIMMGASGSVVAILIAIARYSPDYRLYLPFVGQVLLKYVALTVFIIDIISIPTLKNTGGVFAHLGGAAFGYFYAASVSKGHDVTLGLTKLTDSIAAVFSHKSKLKVSHRRPVSDMEFNARKITRQKEVDRVLDKIKASGYDSLTKEEKQILFDASK